MWIGRKIRWLTLYIYSYGSTESCAGVVYQRVGVSPAGSIGYLTANTELKLVDENDNGMEFMEIQYKRTRNRSRCMDFGLIICFVDFLI